MVTDVSAKIPPSKDTSASRFFHDLRVRFTIFTIFGRTDLRISLFGAKFDEEANFDVHSAVGPPKPHQIDEKLTFRSENVADFFFFRRRKIESCKSSETRVAEVSRRWELCSRGKRTFEVRGHRAASAGRAKRKQYAGVLEPNCVLNHGY